jgi:branched-chain amino acid aminotransferase
MKIYIDGKYYEKDEAKISVFDHGLLYGDGIFEGIRIYNGKVFKLREHIGRLYDGANAIALAIPLSREEMENRVNEAVKVNEKKDGYIRLIVTRGMGDLGVSPSKCPKPSVIIITGDISLYPREYYEKGIPVMTSSVRRVSPQNFDARIKSLNYLNNILAKIEAERSGCLEAIMLNDRGFVAECTGDNIFIIKKGTLYTPPSYDSILEGITRGTVMSLAAGIGIKVEEKSLTQFDLYTADECFLTGTGAELIPVTTIDGRTIGSGGTHPVTDSIRKEFQKLVNG